MNKIPGLILQTLSILCLLRLISNQVNTNIEKLQNDFKDKARGFNYRMDWFKPDKMSNFAKFYLCVDIFQKQMNVILTGGLYQVNTSNHELPNFEGKFLKIKNIDVLYPTVLKHVMHCPLHVISFENINYMLGTEFYITESPNEYCVYSLYSEHQPSQTEPILHITAEICGLFMNISNDKMKLEREFEDHLIRKGNKIAYDTFLNRALSNSPVVFVNNDHANEGFIIRISTDEKYILLTGVSLLTWPDLDRIDNKDKFLLCLHVHEKLAHEGYFRIPYNSSNPNNELPICNVVANDFIFTTYKGVHPKGFIDTLYCPMHTIQFLTKNKTLPKSLKTTITPFYLAQSVNPNCVYKMGINGMKFQHQMHNNLSHEVFIQGEICGIQGTVDQDIARIESKFLLTWNSRHRADIESGGEILLMSLTKNQIQLCGNVFRSVYNNTTYLYDKAPFSVPKTSKAIIFVGHLNMTVTVIICNVEKYMQYKVLPLTYSANLGCVYTLKVIKINKLDINPYVCHISSEVCNVYPPRHLLQIRKYYLDPIF